MGWSSPLLERLVVEDLAGLLRVVDDVDHRDLAQLGAGDTDGRLGLRGHRRRGLGGRGEQVDRGSGRRRLLISALNSGFVLDTGQRGLLVVRGAGGDQRRQSPAQTATLAHARSSEDGGTGTVAASVSGNAAPRGAATGVPGVGRDGSGGSETPRRASSRAAST